MVNWIRWDNPDIGDAELHAAINSLTTHIGANGPNVTKLESELGIVTGAKHVVCVNNGTSALLAACLALKHTHGDLKIGVPNFSFIASANAPKFVWNNIDFVDVDLQTWNVRNDYVPPSIDALMAVDVAGLPCDYDELAKLGIPIIADSAESLGSKYKGKNIGTQACMHCFSMHRSKIITCGEGGFITTNSDEYASLLRSYISHGYDLNKEPWEYKHSILGLNFRMNDVEAAIARVQLKKLEFYVKHRHNLAQLYRENLSERFLFQEFDDDLFNSNYFMFGIIPKCRSRNQVIDHLTSNRVVVKGWSALAGQECYKSIDPPNSKYIGENIVLLPISNMTTEDEVMQVSELLNSNNY